MDTFRRGEIHPTAVVSDSADVGEDVTIGAFTVVHAGTVVGDRSVIGSHCSLGEPTGAFYEGRDEPGSCDIGPDSLIRSHTVIYRGATLGSEFRCGHRVTIREGSVIGSDVQIGTQCDLQGDLRVGDHARLHSSVFVAQRSSIEKFVWLFPRVLLTNDPHPPSDTCTMGPTIRAFAAVGADAVVLPGVEIGEHALVGAKSLVVKDVDRETVVTGIPARARGSVRDVSCRHGTLEQVYPWPIQFRRGYPDGVLPDPSSLVGE